MWKEQAHFTVREENSNFNVYSVVRRNKKYEVAISLDDNFIDPFLLHKKYGWSRIFQIPNQYYETKKPFIDIKLNLALNLINQTKIKGTQLVVKEFDDPVCHEFLNNNYMTGTWISENRNFSNHITCEENGNIVYMLSFAPFKNGQELIRVCSLPNIKMHKITPMLNFGFELFKLKTITLRARLQFFNSDVAVNKKVFGKQVINQIVNLAEKSLQFDIIGSEQ